MNLFVQGMRRSGTTIVYDVLSEDPRFDVYYEPLAAGKKTIGGGSGVQSIDVFEKVRRLRSDFLEQYSRPLSPELLNHGAPRAPETEFEADVPEYIRDYLGFIVSKAEDTAIKFTRMYRKVRALWELDPTAKLVHVVRDPRATTVSYLFGKGQKHKHKFRSADELFGRTSGYSAWSSHPFSEFLLATDEFRHLRGCEDFMRILLLWKFTFRETRRDGRDLFGPRYMLLRHEDLTADPERTVGSLYDFIGCPPPPQILHWARSNVRPARAPYAADDRRWREGVARLDMRAELEAAGYDL